MGYNTFLSAHKWLLGAERVDNMLLKLDKDGNIIYDDDEGEDEDVADLAPRPPRGPSPPPPPPPAAISV